MLKSKTALWTAPTLRPEKPQREEGKKMENDIQELQAKLAEKEKEIERLKKVEKVLNDEIDLLNTAFKSAIRGSGVSK